MWKFLRHPNVLPLIGVLMLETRFAMVSDWMMNGSIDEYVKTHQDANPLGLVGSPFLALLSFGNNPSSFSWQVPPKG